MRGDRIITVFLFLGSAALLALGVMFYLRRDRTEPAISFSETDVVYTAATTEEELLEGVSAMDARDGDVTDRIVVEKVVANTGARTAVVYYAASDESGNVAKASRQFPAEAEDMHAGAQAAPESGEDTTGGIGISEDEAEEEKEASEASEEISEMTAEETEEPAPSEEELRAAEEEQAAEEQARQEAAEQAARERREEEERQAAEAAERRRQEEEAAANAEKPHITLRRTAVTVPAGTGPAWTDVISSLTDDKDGYEILFKNLSVSRYDRNTPGTYDVTLTTTDSDGNVSDPARLSITVR